MTTMPFGKYKGVSFPALPTDYLDWLMSITLREPLRTRVKEEWERRINAIPVPMTLAVEDREMASELIRVGYKTVAQRVHPDTGGSHEDMTRLNRAVAFLRHVVTP